MSDTPSSPPLPPAPPPVRVRRGLGAVGAFIIGVVAAVMVLAGAMISLPFWPEQARALWRGQAAIPPAPTPGIDLPTVQAAADTVAKAAVEAARRDLTVRLDDLEKRLSAVSATAGRTRRTGAPKLQRRLVAELRSERSSDAERAVSTRRTRPRPKRRPRLRRPTSMPKRKSPRCTARSPPCRRPCWHSIRPSTDRRTKRPSSASRPRPWRMRSAPAARPIRRRSWRRAPRR